MKVTSVSQTLYLLFITSFLLLFTFIFAQAILFEEVFLPQSNLMFKIMLYYLFFIFFRIGMHLILSFLDYLFTIRLPEPTHHPLVTVIMPCFNEEVGLEAAVNSVTQIDYPNIEVIIVDDGSHDSTLDIGIELSRKRAPIRVITQVNSGKAAALNFGISEANGDYVLCMDSDSILSKNCVKMAIKYFLHYPKLGAIAGGVHVSVNKKVITWLQSLEYIIGLNFFKSAQSALSIVPIVPGPIGIFKKDAILSVGGYRSNTFAEDADLSMRLLLAGYQIKYCAAIKAITEAPETINQLLTQRYRWNRGMVQTIKENIRTIDKRNHKGKAVAILSYMISETIIIPLANFTFAVSTIQFALVNDNVYVVGFFFIGLTILDLVLSLYSVVMEKKSSALFLLAIFNRTTYGLSLEIVRFFSLIDEFFNIPMKWGTLKRKGIKQ